jgi:acyl-coenzyme A synthetase/AMP-(fatty) acid ligase
MLLDEVVDVQIYGEKHLLLGQIVVAKIILIDDADTESMKLKVKKHCQQHLTKYKVPQKIYFVKELEMSSRGKRIKNALTKDNINE